MNARVALRSLRANPIGTFFGPRHRATVTVRGSHQRMARLAVALTEEMDDDAWATLPESTRRVINAVAGCDGIDATRYAVENPRVPRRDDAGALRIVVYVKPGASRRRMLRLAAALAKVTRLDFDAHALTKRVS